MLTDTLLAVVLFSVLLGLSAAELAMLLRVGSASLPWLKKVWTWSASGKPLNCPTCMGAWCTFIVLGGAAVLICDWDASRAPRTVALLAAALPAAAAIAAVVQRWVLPDELALPEVVDEDEVEGPKCPRCGQATPGAFWLSNETPSPCGDCTGPQHHENGPSAHRYCPQFGKWLHVNEPCTMGKLSQASFDVAARQVLAAQPEVLSVEERVVLARFRACRGCDLEQEGRFCKADREPATCGGKLPRLDRKEPRSP